LVLLLLVLFLLLKVPYVQNCIKSKVLNSLSDTYGAEWKIGDLRFDFFDEVEATDIFFKDQLGDTLMYARKLHVDIGLLDLLGRKIQLDDIKLTGAISNIYILENGEMNYNFLLVKGTEDTVSKETDTKSWEIGIGNVILKEPDIDYSTEDLTLGAKGKQLDLKFDIFNLVDKELSLDRCSVDNFDIIINSEASKSNNQQFSLPDLGWQISNSDLTINETKINYIQSAKPINVENLNLHLYELSYDGTNLSGKIDNTSFSLDEKLQLQKLTTEVKIEGAQVSIPKLEVRTLGDLIVAKEISYDFNNQNVRVRNLRTNIAAATLSKLSEFIPDNIKLLPTAGLSILADELTYTDNQSSATNLLLEYGSAISANASVTVKATDNNIKNAYLNGNLTNLTVSIPLLAKVFPAINIPDSLRQYENIKAQGSLKGSAKNMDFKDFYLKVDNVLETKFDGNIKNLDDSSLLNYNVNIENIKTNINALPIGRTDNLALDSLGQLEFAGILNGDAKNVSLDGALQSDLGALKANIYLENINDLDRLVYSGDVSLDKFKLGTLINNNQLDVITLKTYIEGKGLNLNDLNTKVNGTISDFSYLDYQYADVKVNAIINEKKINGKVEINDKNIKLSYQGVTSLEDDASVLNFTLDIDTINLKALQLWHEEVNISARIDSKIKLPLPKNESGNILITDLVMRNINDKFEEDTLSIIAEKTTDSTYVVIRSGFLKADIDGKFKIREIPAAIHQTLQYYQNPDSIGTKASLESKAINIKGNIATLKPVDILFNKSIVQSKPINLGLSLNLEKYATKGYVQTDSLTVSNVFAETLRLNINSENDDLNIAFNTTNTDLNGIQLAILDIDNKVNQAGITSKILSKDTDNLPQLKFQLFSQQTADEFNISLRDSLVVNTKNWKSENENLIRIFDNKLIVENFTLSDKNEYLRINSPESDPSRLNIDMKNFSINQLTTLLTNKPSKLSGNIDGTIKVEDILDDLYYIANIQIEELTYDSTAVGTFSIKAEDNIKSNILSTELSLIGPNNNINGRASYNTKTQAIDAKLDLKSLQLMLLDPFLGTVMKDSEGILKGTVSVTGTPDLPIINGSATLDDAVTTIIANNTRYGIDEHTLTFNNDAIDIGSLDIYDERNNVANVSGKIYHDFLNDIELDIEIRTDKFTFLNTTVKDNPVFHGKLILDANAIITGPIDLLYLDVLAETLDSSKVTISPFSIEKYLKKEDFITYGKPEDFVDLSNEYLLKLARQYPFKVNILLDANKNTELNFIVDPITGDRIVGRGSGDLRIKLDPDGKQEIFGNYVVDEGSYSFSYGDIVSKDFVVRPGGNVRFNGNPLDAVLDIDAVYNVYTTTYELIKNEISIDDSEVSSAQRRTNVEVHLQLNGTLNEPAIKLDIQVPDLQSSSLTSSIDRKLNELRSNPNELNSQVFGLLIFDSFLLSDNVSTGLGGVGSNIALNSISSLITSQLNNFASDVIKGVDVNVNINSYDSKYANGGAGGNVTEVGLQVSKQLFNDRLSISAGGNFDLSENNNGGSYSSFIGDFVLEYKLTADGKYRVRVFSKSDYDRLLNENTNKNGVSLYFSKSFDSKIK